MISPSNRPIRIAGASGSVSDRRFALASFARNSTSEPVDVICCDYMSEGTMAPSALRRANNAKSSDPDPKPSSLLDPVGPAYETTFVEAIEPALKHLAEHGIRVAVNAGASDTEKCYHGLTQMIEAQGLDIPVAWVDGDEVTVAIERGLKNGTSKFKNIYTGQEMDSWETTFERHGAQAYLGGLGIAEAFSQGAQIVVCGRVSDASPYIGAVFWWHGWTRDMLPQLANALVAGHLLECSTYVTGGNYSGFQELEHTPGGGWADLGFPIGEIAHDGSVTITKQRGTGGAVTVDTCSSQLLYEIQGPWYFNSDVTAILENIWFEQLGPDRVALHGVQALPPPSTTKVGVTALGGYQAEMLWFLTGLDIDAKARMLEAQVRRALEPYSSAYTLLKFHLIGTPAIDADSQDAATACFRIFAQARTVDALAPSMFLRPITDIIMQPYPGGTYHLDIRQGLPKPYFEYYVTLLPQSEIQHVVHFGGKKTLISSPPQTQTFPLRQPSQPSTAQAIPASSMKTVFGPTKRVPLGSIVYARSGDKGPDCNCGFSVKHEDEYVWLRNLLSVENIKILLGKEYERKKDRLHIERFELPKLRGVHFLFRNLLDRGVTSTSEIDFLGKNCCEFLRQRVVDVPVKFLERGVVGRAKL